MIEILKAKEQKAKIDLTNQITLFTAIFLQIHLTVFPSRHPSCFLIWKKIGKLFGKIIHSRIFAFLNLPIFKNCYANVTEKEQNKKENPYNP